MNNFAKLLYQLRKQKGLTQSELGDLLGLTDKAISRWETGESFPDTAMLVPLSNIFSITVDELLRGVLVEEENIKLNEVKKYFEEQKNIEKPLTRAEGIKVAIAVSLLILGIFISIILFIAYENIDYKNENYLFLVPSALLGVISLYMLIDFGMNKSIKDAGLGKDIIDSVQNHIKLVAIGTNAMILIAFFIAAYFIDNKNIFFLLVGAILFILGLAFTIIGGTAWKSEALSKIVNYTPIKISRKNEEIIGTIWACLSTSSIFIYVIIGLIWKIWSPTWIIFIVMLFIGVLCSIIFGNKDHH